MEYSPTKDTCVALILALRLNISEADSLLEKNGMSLSKSIERDIVIRFCVENEMYDIDVVNGLLNEFTGKKLGRA